MTDYTGFNTILTQHGRDAHDYRIDLKVLDTNNQVIIVRDVVRKLQLEVPVEEPVLQWSMTRLAETVCEALDQADKRMYLP